MSTKTKNARSVPEKDEKKKLTKEEDKQLTSRKVSTSSNLSQENKLNKTKGSLNSARSIDIKKIKPSNVETKSIESAKKSVPSIKNVKSTLIKGPSTSRKVVSSKPSHVEANTAPKKRILKEEPLKTSIRPLKKSIGGHSGIQRNNSNSVPKINTSVTVNSPPQKRKHINVSDVSNIIDDKENNKDLNLDKQNDISININNHKRYRTRTLDPEEVKIIDKIKSDDIKSKEVIKNEEKNNAFFIPLNETKDQEQNNITAQHQSASQDDELDSYEDDFESYESDFDSFKSSDLSGQSDVASERSDLSTGSDDASDDVKIKPEEEKKFDSGNYELGESLKQNDFRAENALEKITEIDNDSVLHPYASLTDEGFDENSVGFAVQNSNNAIKPQKDADKTLQYRIQRSKDLKNLITLDEVKYSLFEMFPMCYDTFISIYGKSNTHQVYCQTNNDSIDANIQTDALTTENKWTQHPPAFSNNSIFGHNASPLDVYINQRLGCGSDDTQSNKRMQSAYKENVVKLSKFISNTGKFILEYLNEQSMFDAPNDDPKGLHLNDAFKFIKNRPVERLFMSSDSSKNIFLTVHPSTHDENCNNTLLKKYTLGVWSLDNNKINLFKVLTTLDKIISCAINAASSIVVAGLENGNVCAWDLKEEEIWHEDVAISEINSDERRKNKFESSNSVPSKNNMTFRNASFHTSSDISRRSNLKKHLWGSVVDILFKKFNSETSSNDDYNTYEVSNAKDEQVYSLQEYGILSIWSVVNKSADIKRAYNVSSYDLYDSYWSRISLIKTNMVNLKNLMHKEMTFSMDHSDDEDIGGKPKDKRNNRLENVQFDELDKKGIIRAFSDDEEFMDDDVRTSKLCHTEEKYARNDSNDEFKRHIICNHLKHIQSANSLLITCNGYKIINYLLIGLRKKPYYFTCEDDGCMIYGIEACPSNLPYFLANCSNSVIHLYSMTEPKPIKNFTCDAKEYKLYKNTQLSNASSNIIFKNVSLEDRLLSVMDFKTYDGDKKCIGSRIQWMKSNPYIFLTVYDDDKIAIWDLLNSDVTPKLFLNVYYGKNKSIDQWRSSDDVSKSDPVVDMKILPQCLPANKNLLVLHLSSGEIQIYKIHENYVKSTFEKPGEELEVLKTYFQLL